MLTRVRPALLVLVTVAAALALPATAGAATANPKAGQCHQLTLGQVAAASDTKRAVSCSNRHNLQTVAVVTSPTSLAGLTQEENSELGSRLCRPTWAKALGRTARVREQTAYSEFFFSPTAAQVAAGARWFRCDIGLVAGPRVISLPHRRLARPIIGSQITDSTRRCLTSRWYITTCSYKHAFRSIGAVVVRTSGYPTGDQVVAAAYRGCPKAWTDVFSPTELAWKHGDHVAVCYVKTRR